MSDLLKEASLLLSREASRLPAHAAGTSQSGNIAATQLPSGGGSSPGAPDLVERAALRRQLDGVIETLQRLLPPEAAPLLQERAGMLSRVAQGAAGRASSLAGRFSGSSGATRTIPAFRSAAAVAAGGIAHFALTVANRSDAAYPVALCSTALIAGTGFEIPAVHVVAAPRVLQLAPRSEDVFDVAVHVPRQAAPGTYAGLIRALGHCDFQAALALEVS